MYTIVCAHTYMSICTHIHTLVRVIVIHQTVVRRLGTCHHRSALGRVHESGAHRTKMSSKRPITFNCAMVMSHVQVYPQLRDI